MIGKSKLKNLTLPKIKQPKKFLPNQTKFINEDNDKVSVKVDGKPTKTEASRA